MSTPPEKTKSMLPTRSGHDRIGQVVGAFESETAAVILKTSPKNQHIIIYALGVGFLLAFILAAFVKLDRVVVGVGRIVPVGGSLFVSPFDNSIVREVRVKPGDIVKKGQVLATLDATFTEADRTQLTGKLASDEAAVARLEAELAGKPYKPDGRNPSELLQASIYHKRQAEYQSNLADFDARIRSNSALVGQYESDVRQYKKRVELADNLEKLYEPLVDKGYVSKLQLMQTRDSAAEANRLLSDAEQTLQSTQHTLSALKAQRESFVQKWLSDTGTELVTNRNDADLTRQSLQKATRLNELSTLNAPADAVVLKVGKVSPGAVAGSAAAAQGGEALFTLVPLDAPVEVDLKILTRDIGFVQAGDHVEIKLDAYGFLQHGTAKGKVTSVSEGSFTSDDNNAAVEPYFRATVAITDAKLRNVPKDFRIVPGMTVEGEILVGRRTIMSYLVEGILKTGSEAMREPL